MSKIAFIGFGEVNTPVDVVVRKCAAAEAALKAEGLDLISVFPVADDYEEKQIGDVRRWKKITRDWQNLAKKQ